MESLNTIDRFRTLMTGSAGGFACVTGNSGATQGQRLRSLWSWVSRKILPSKQEPVVRPIGICLKHILLMLECRTNGWKSKDWSISNLFGVKLKATDDQNCRLFAQWSEPPCADPHAGWCRDRGLITPGYPISGYISQAAGYIFVKNAGYEGLIRYTLY